MQITYENTELPVNSLTWSYLLYIHLTLFGLFCRTLMYYAVSLYLLLHVFQIFYKLLKEYKNQYKNCINVLLTVFACFIF